MLCGRLHRALRRKKVNEEKKCSKGQITALVLTSLLITGLIIGAFLFSEQNRFIISRSIITLVCLLIILVLSNSFDNFSIGKIFSMSREVKESKEKIKELEKEKTEILLKLINLNFQSQNSSITVNTGSNDSNTSLVVENLDKEEKETKEKEEENIKDNQENISRKRLNPDKFQSLILNKYYGKSKDDSLLMRDVKVVDQFQDIDSISNKPVYFDAYLKESNAETFIDIRKNGLPSVMFHDRLYVQLNKILMYRKNNEVNAQLLLITAKEKKSVGTRNQAMFYSFFEPAVKCGILKIVDIEYTKKEYESCLEEIIT